jgi:protein O-GlcNAc transferase
MNINGALRSALQHQQTGNFKQAENLYRKILKKQPDNFDALHMLGVLLSQTGQHNPATEYIEKAIQLKPTSFHAHYNLGNVFAATGHNEQAISCYRMSLQINQDFVPPSMALGNIFQAQKQFDESIACYNKVIAFTPDPYEAHHNLGDILLEIGEVHEAISHYVKALEINPDLPGTYNNLGIALKAQGRLEEAINAYQKAVMLNPQFTNAWYNLGTVLRQMGKMEEAVNAYDMALRSNPNDIKSRWAQCIAQLPIMYSSLSSIEVARKQYIENLLEFRDSLLLGTKKEREAAAEAVGSQQPFYLAYQGSNDLEPQKIYGDMVCQIMALQYPQYAEPPTMPSYSAGGQLRIGIVSGYFSHHTIWKLFRGWIENLDRQRFSLYGYYTGRIQDHFTDAAKRHFSCFTDGHYSFENLCRLIRKDQLHVLIFPEIGMDPKTMRLAALKLAPVQCVSWGHPDTTGFPTIDYFISSDLMEPPDAENHYSEQLVRLPNISISYTPLDVPVIPAGRDTFGLREQSVLYLCCQSLFKYLPQYDEIFPRIAHSVRDCQFLFISHQSDFVTEQFRSRINMAFHTYGLTADDHIVFLPRLTTEEYFAMNRLADVYLDSIGWSGGNTTLEAIANHLPVVTLPGQFMRSRHSFAMLTMMGIHETIASTEDEYISLAVRLGTDKAWRNKISGEIAENCHRLYRDRNCITALEEFLIEAIQEKTAKN